MSEAALARLSAAPQTPPPYPPCLPFCSDQPPPPSVEPSQWAMPFPADTRHRSPDTAAAPPQSQYPPRVAIASIQIDIPHRALPSNSTARSLLRLFAPDATDPEKHPTNRKQITASASPHPTRW